MHFQLGGMVSNLKIFSDEVSEEKSMPKILHVITLRNNRVIVEQVASLGHTVTVSLAMTRCNVWRHKHKRMHVTRDGSAGGI